MTNYDLSSYGAICAAVKEAKKAEDDFTQSPPPHDPTKYPFLVGYRSALENVSKQLAPQQHLLDSIMNYLGEHFDSSKLYQMFHEDMGMSNEDIEFLGFNLPQCRRDTIENNQYNEKMQIVDKFSEDALNTIYTVSLEPGYMVDVKVCADNDLVYVMQNHDGSSVYGISGPDDATFPNYHFDEVSVIGFVKDFHSREKTYSKSSLSDQIQSASTRAAELRSASDEKLEGPEPER